MTQTTQSNFQDRIQRISKEKEQSKATASAANRTSKARRFLINAKYPASICVAAFTGLAAVFLVRYLRFQLMGAGDASSGILVFLLDAILSIAGCVAIKELFRMHSPEFKTAQVVGIFIMVISMHNLAFWAPNFMSSAFSRDWVVAQEDYAMPNSIYLGGFYFPLVTKSQSNPNLPRITYAN
jgi:hypothetical protein